MKTNFFKTCFGIVFFVLAGCGSSDNSAKKGTKQKSLVIEHLKAQGCPEGLVKNYKKQVKDIKTKYSEEERKKKLDRLLVTVKSVPCK